VTFFRNLQSVSKKCKKNVCKAYKL